MQTANTWSVEGAPVYLECLLLPLDGPQRKQSYLCVALSLLKDVTDKLVLTGWHMPKKRLVSSLLLVTSLLGKELGSHQLFSGRKQGS